MDLRVLGASVAIYIDGVIEGRREEIAFKTDPNFQHPLWDTLSASEQLGPDDFGLESGTSLSFPPLERPTQLHVDPIPATLPRGPQSHTESDFSGRATPVRETSPEFDDFVALFGPQSDILPSSPHLPPTACTETMVHGEPSTPCQRRNRAQSIVSSRSEPRAPTKPSLHHPQPRRPFVRCQSSPGFRARSTRLSLSTIKWFED
ncbi:hypothetical protein BKA67DRAFT_663196 [Truncatella angustata]|uniref:Uncharacterized protein n=1 Tax=Truncatella angustata TaxID=152316 RepID=A0A9P8RJ37_9PEZI|nr:uncharacterized protein BKA67DRAFT_663196 [Truncatella angustata]KAH6646812.1 hypothetical protein BKA67DRAFT_663196 [Truncatella angustata]